MKLSEIIKMSMASLPIPVSRLTGLFQSRPIVFGVYITERCNLRCRMCDIWSRVDVKSELGQKELDRLLKEIKQIGIKLLAIGGGEPLLKEGIFDFVKKAKKMGFVVHMNSNGTLVSDEKKAEQIASSGIDSFTISFDGLKETHDEIRNAKGTFDKAINAIKLLAAARNKLGKKMRIGTSTVIMKRNLGEMKELTLILKETGVDAIAFQPFTVGLMNDDRAKKMHMITEKRDIEKLKSLIKWIIKFKKETGLIGNSYKFLELIPDYFLGKKMPSCFAGYFNMDMDSKGNISPCIAMKPVGNFKKNSLKDIWNNEGYKRFRKNIVPSCQKCFIGCYGEPSLLYNPRYMLSSFRNVVDKLRFME